VFHGATVRRLVPLVERLIYFAKLPKRLLTPPKPATAPKTELVQIVGQADGVQRLGGPPSP
jgi:hypothetical protein